MLSAPTAQAQRTLYVTGDGGAGNGVHSFAIDLTDGSLSEIGSVVGAGIYPTAPSMKPDGSVLAAPDIYGGQIFTYPINLNGSPGAGTAFPAGLSPNAAIFTPDGSALFAADTYASNVLGYSVSGSTLSAPISEATPGAPTTIAMSPASDHVYAPGWTNDLIDAFTYGANPGELDNLAGFPLATAGQQPVDIEFSPNAQFVYAENVTTADITTFSRNVSTGALTEIGSRPALSGSPSGISASPNGDWFAAVSSGASGGLQMFSVAGSGQLTAVGSTLSIQTNGAYDAVFTPDSRFLYVTGVDGSVSGFGINQSTGAATELSGSPWAVADSTFGLVITPDQGPTAAFSSSVSDLTAIFDASASSDSDGTVATYTWDFGDGSVGVTASPVTTHTYAANGNYTATLTVTDNENCSSSQIGTGQTINCNGTSAAQTTGGVAIAYSPPVPPAPAPVGDPLILSKLSIKEYPLRTGETRRRVITYYSLNRKAGVTIQFRKVNRGRLVNGKCKYESSSNKRHQKCLHVRNYGGQVKLRGNPGSNRKTFVKTFGGKDISRGRYTEVIFAADSNNIRSKTGYRSFRVQDPGR